MKNFLIAHKRTIQIIQGILFVFFSILVWNLAAKHHLFTSFDKSFNLMICEICWATEAYLMVNKQNGVYTLILSIIPILLSVTSEFPFILIISTILIGIVNILIRIPKMQIKNYYGLFCFSLTNAIIPVTAINYMSRQYLEQSTVLNVGILVTLYFLFYNLVFKDELADAINVICIICFSGLILANFPINKDILLIALVLLSYGIQIFMRQEKITWSLLSFFIISIIAFI
ncbi:hypothetical protein [Fructilactobacillus sanfranciscensis]|uniref:Uncharacterized protein n=1 Tax=Fructilactobacillus sanfranciscensis TaxID=1625 RepID=A0A5C4TJP5_FRUSA|nr:hypothetical protein [Fructilactobacillus sanfranciscensis]MDN4461748.1 hypothetical protein [Fructilactobacillus sanfranciscensis]MVF15111.1 hypothetical protein [Fructilactobacillus sanfranciscensis]NDR61131.1 hypothetical protein [Fructilactobacillus sanfranciscensis]TNK90786.1 hypothetical protein DID87_02330 [Fructilactobacillus sanfranciscensis]